MNRNGVSDLSGAGTELTSILVDELKTALYFFSKITDHNLADCLDQF